MIDATQARIDIVRPALTLIGMHSPAAEDLVMLTAAVESALGRFVRQHPTGPALGWCQMEPFTHTDLWESYIRHKVDLARMLAAMVPDCHWHSGDAMPRHEALIGNFLYSAAMARVRYRPAKPALPEAGDWPALADYWDRYYQRDRVNDVARCLKAGRDCGVIPRTLAGAGGE